MFFVNVYGNSLSVVWGDRWLEGILVRLTFEETRDLALMRVKVQLTYLFVG